jgi:hypothetical protein
MSPMSPSASREPARPRRARRLIWAAALTLLVATAAATPTPPPQADDRGWLGLVQLASLRLRLKRLDAAEHQALVARRARGDSPRRIYDDQIQRWLDRDLFARLAIGMIPVPDHSSLFIETLQRARDPGGEWIYYLPHAAPALAPGAPPCRADDRVKVAPWWARDRKIALCAHSYLPERAFDSVGYCAGQPEPLRPIAPRAGCGCGPLLLACLPPTDEAPALNQRLLDAMTDEISVTGADIIARGGSLDELMTTSRTWQTGLVEFLYARRDMLAALASQPYSSELESRLRARLATIDLDRGGRWVDRKAVYEGSGLFLTTPLMGSFLGTPRAEMAFLLSQFLCTDFPANHVDSEALLAVTRGQHQGVRFEVYESPMRNQASCSGCHAPMDFGAGFMVGLLPPLFGSIPTTKRVEGRLYINGASDLRGSGVGFGALMTLVTRQPEFPRCAVARMFTYLVGRPPRVTDDESRVMADLVETFERSGRRLDTLIRAILASRPATEPVDLTTGGPATGQLAPRALAPAATVPRRAGELLQQHCVRCHDGRRVLDLRTPPPAHDAETWGRIRTMVETGRMPPYDDARQTPQVMAPGARQELVAVARSVVAWAHHPLAARAQIDLSPRDWVYVVREVAAPFVSPAAFDAILASRRDLSGDTRQLWIAIDVCTAMFDADARTPPTERRFARLAAGPLDDAAVDQVVAGLHELVYREPPTARDAAAGRAQLRRFESHAHGGSDAAVALCTSYLSGPRVMRVRLGERPAAPGGSR